MSSNGHLKPEELSPIPGGQLAKEAAIAWLAMRKEIIRRGGPAIRPGGSDSSYRSYDRQVYWKNYWTQKGQPYKAATPGTSNHGLGMAVDDPEIAAQKWILKLGPEFGWSHNEGARVGEPWHFTYIGGYSPYAQYGDINLLTPYERKIVKRYVTLKIADKDRPRRAKLRMDMRRRMTGIWVAAQKSGWVKADRRKRYNLLKKVLG